MTREEAIEYLHKLFMQADITDAYGDMDNTEPYEIAMDMAVEALSDAPDTNVGKWIPVDVGDCCYRCSECGFIRDAYLLDVGCYCPQCGAKMENAQ